MKIYRIEGGTFRAGPGMGLMLTQAQAAERSQNLVHVEPRGAVVLATANGLLDFKVGEALGLASLDKSMAHLVVEVDGSKVKFDSPEAVLTAALVSMAEELAATEAEAAKAAKAAAPPPKPAPHKR